MKDRLAFETIPLSNGMKLYAQYNPDVEFAHLTAVAPFGSEHNSGCIIPGSFHFMEHLVIKRSKEYPESNQFTDLVALQGGTTGATTYGRSTEYDLSIASHHFDSFSRSLITHFFYPEFRDEDIVSEANIISNERNRMNKYYPATTETGHYITTQWKGMIVTTPEQRLGSDDDHLKFSAEYFKELHAYYRTVGSYFVAIGNFDIQKLAKTIQELSPEILKKVSPQALFTPYHWVNPEFRSYPSDEVLRHEYQYSWIIPDSEEKEVYNVQIQNFIKEMLADYSLGKIFQWLRREKGWIYNMPAYNSSHHGVMIGGLNIPLNSMEQVDQVRSELEGRIYDALSSRDLLATVKEKFQNERVFFYETMEKRLNRVCDDLRNYGRFYTESDHVDMKESITTDVLLSYFEKAVTNKGEIVVIPKK